MTRFNPSLFVKRLVVQRNGAALYDEQFHKGVNVIRGQNSSGKSTILNFIFYGLGGDLSEWSDKALLCTDVVVEVELNGMPATLRRDILEQSGAPMEIFGGSYEASRSAPRNDWIKYPYRRNQNQESFSQAIFRLLGVPEALNDKSGAITIHQILRLLYADQLSPISKLFRDENFDQAALRETVGRLLCGAYTGDLYSNELQVRNYVKEFDAVDLQLRSLIAALGTNDIVPSYEWVEAVRQDLQAELAQLNADMERGERQIYVADDPDAGRISLEEQNAAYSKVQLLQSEIVDVRKAYDKVTFDIADSANFIRGLTDKLTALRDASTTAKHFGIVKFHSCPACYSAVEELQDDAHCHLCRAPFDTTAMKERIAGLINENAIQIKQSETLQKRREVRQRELAETLSRLESDWSAASERLASLQRLPSSQARRALRELHRKIGYVERQIEDVEAKGRTILKITELSQKKETLQALITRLKTANEAIVESQKKQLLKAHTQIAEEVRSLLKGDLRRQDTFEDAKYVKFSFKADEISVDGETYFSASSRAILKSSFCLGFWAAAAKDPTFRHPRFAMIDVLENMGVEPERSHNFQKLIAETSAALPSDHQIIYATAMIAPELDDETYTIGRYSTLDEPTLAFKS